MRNGTVVTKNEKGFGFIKVDDEPPGTKDLFFHANELSNVSFDDLHEGDRVTFEIADSPKGRNAVNIAKA